MIVRGLGIVEVRATIVFFFFFVGMRGMVCGFRIRVAFAQE